MTDIEHENAIKQLFANARENGVDTLTVHQSKEYKELSCIEMINSILAYHYNDNAQFVLAREYAARHNYLKEYVDILGEEKVLSLIQNQINDIKTIDENVFTDDEGLHYNSIVWVR